MDTFTPVDPQTGKPYGDDHDSQVRLLMRINELKRADRYDEAALYRQQLIIPATALMVAKKLSGTQWIRDRKLRTEKAEAKYGKDWLDQ